MKKIILLIPFLLLGVLTTNAQCNAPTNAAVTEITSNSALLSWDAVSTGSEVQFYQTSFVEGTAEAIDGATTVTTSLASYYPLLPGTTYTAYVKSFCSGVWSDWTTGVTFTTTSCPAVQPPYTLDFETVTASLIPECTTAVTSLSPHWKTVTNPGFGFESGTLKYIPSNAVANSFLFTQGITLEAGTNYKISFRYGNNSTETTESIMLTYGLSPTAEDAMPLYAATIDDAIPHTHDHFFTVEETGTYYIGFRAVSEANQGELYVDDFSIQQTVCGTPENAMASAVTYSSATISWEEATEGNISSTGYYFGYSTTNTPPDSPETITELSQDLSELEANTTYYAFVKNVCGDVNSEWEVIEFTTPCVPVALPYTIDFESVDAPDFPECTAAFNLGTGNNWTTTNNPGNGFETNTLVYNTATEAANAVFVTAPVELEAATYYKVTFRYGNNSDATAESFNLKFGTSPDPETWTGTLMSVTGINDGEEHQFVSPPFSPAAGVYYFGIQATSDASQGGLYIDDITISEWTCELPENPNITALSSESATIEWSPAEGGTAMGYFYTYGTSSTPSEEDMAMTTELNITFDELEPDTTYYVFLRTFCGPAQGEWTQAIIFNTPCTETATVPYYQDFESATAPAIPACNSLATNSGNMWSTANNPGSGFETNTLQYTGTEAIADSWYFTQGIELTAGTRYKVEYTYGNDSSEFTETLKVTLTTNPDPVTASQGGVLGNHSVTAATPATNEVNYITVQEDGIYYIGFNAQSEGGQGSIYVDNFSIEESSCGVPANLQVSDITDSSATLTWEGTTEGNSDPNVYQYAIGNTETPPAEGTQEGNFTTNFSELEPETTYYAFVRTQCGPIWSDWVMVSFTTEEELGIDENNFKGFAYYPNPTKNNITVSNTNIIDTVEVYNITGQLVLQQNINAEQAEINMNDLSAGAYFLTVHSGNNSKQIKVLKID